MAKENKNVKEIIVKIEGEEFTKALDKAFKELSKDASVDGFRKGKVPRDVFEKKYGKERIMVHASDNLMQDAYMKAVTENELMPVAQPTVDIKSLDDKHVEFVFRFVTKPEVKVKKYKGLGVKADKVKVTKEEIEHEISHMLERFQEEAVKEGKVENGNIAIIDFEGFKEGVAFDGGKGENYPLEIGSNTFIPGFEEQLVGMNKDEEKEVNVSFPEDYPSEDLKGKAVVFKVKINEVKEKVQREMDADFFEDLAMEGVDSKETLEKEVEANIKANKEMDAENKYIDSLLEEVAKNTEVDIPEEMINEEINRLFGRFEEQLKMQGISLDLYYQMANIKEEDIRSQMSKEAEKHVMFRLVLEEVQKLENITVSDEEADKEADVLADKYEMKKDEFLKAFGGIDMIKYDLETRKTVEMLKEANK